MEDSILGRVVATIMPRREVPPQAFRRPRVLLPAPLRLVARPDVFTAKVVERGIEIFIRRGQLEAIDYFTAHGIPLRVVSRVLWRPDLRRD